MELLQLNLLFAHIIDKLVISTFDRVQLSYNRSYLWPFILFYSFLDALQLIYHLIELLIDHSYLRRGSLVN